MQLFKLIAKRPLQMSDGSVRQPGEAVPEAIEWGTFEYLLGIGRIAFEKVDPKDLVPLLPKMPAGVKAVKRKRGRPRKNDVHV